MGLIDYYDKQSNYLTSLVKALREVKFKTEPKDEKVNKNYEDTVLEEIFVVLGLRQTIINLSKNNAGIKMRLRRVKK